MHCHLHRGDWNFHLTNEKKKTTQSSNCKTSTAAEDAPDGMEDIRTRFSTLGYSSEASHLLMSSRRKPTQKAYNTYVAKWKRYAQKQQIAVSEPDISNIVNFLAHLFQNGANYSAVNTARSALSAFLPRKFSGSAGSHPDVCRLMKGVFELRPALPKYRDTWDPDQVLHCLSSSISSSLQDLSVKTLTLRTATFLALLTGQRGQALHSLKVSVIRFAKDLAHCRIVFSDIHKTSKPSAHTVPSEILAYNANPSSSAFPAMLDFQSGE